MKAAREAGLRFGISSHGDRAWSWYQAAQGADPTGPLAGVPYDGIMTKADGKGKWWEGLDPQDLYAQYHTVGNYDWAADGQSPDRQGLLREVLQPHHRSDRQVPARPAVFRRHRDADLSRQRCRPAHRRVSLQHQPGAQGQAGSGDDRQGPQRRQRRMAQGARLRHRERRLRRRRDLPWQTDTCIGSWHYKRSRFEQHHYKTAQQVMHMLIDIVSKNGNLMLNIPVRGDGTIDDDEVKVLEGIAAWMAVNGEGIYATRPWKVFGEGPTTVVQAAPRPVREIHLQGHPLHRQGRHALCVCHGLAGVARGRDKGSCGQFAAGRRPKVADVSLLGYGGKLEWTQRRRAHREAAGEAPARCFALAIQGLVGRRASKRAESGTTAEISFDWNSS